MQGYTWYKVFASFFEIEILRIKQYYEAVSQNPLPFHSSARIYGYKPYKWMPGEIAITTLQPFILGFIDVLGDASNLSR